MKRIHINNKGYVMTEAIVISAIVLSALILIFAQFAKINRNYNESYYYNNVNGIYALNQIASFIEEDGIEEMVEAINGYLDVTNCSYATNEEYCKLLFEGTDIKHLIFTYNDRYFIDNALAKSNPYNKRMQSFIRTIDDSTADYGALLIAEFNDGSYAALPYGKGLDIIPPKPPTSGSIGNVSGPNPTGTIQIPASGATDNGGVVIYKYLVTNDPTMPSKKDERFTESLNFPRTCGTNYYGWAIAEDTQGNRSEVYNMGSTFDRADSYSGWSGCSEKCGAQGTKTRTNTCDLVTTGLSDTCVVGITSTDTNGKWGSCSAACGPSSRQYTVTRTYRSNEDNSVCSVTENLVTSEQTCDVPSDCCSSKRAEYTNISGWGTCSNSTGCGTGTQYKSATRTYYSNYNNQQCGNPETVNDYQSRSCPLPSCCSSKRAVEVVSNWGTCSSSTGCGTGTQYKTKTTTYYSNYTGEQCGEPVVDTQYLSQSCDTGVNCCSSKRAEETISNWGTCSSSTGCGTGTQYKTKTTTYYSNYTGEQCGDPVVNTQYQSQSCNTGVDCCSSTRTFTEDSGWGTCSSSTNCGIGTQYKTVTTYHYSNYTNELCGSPEVTSVQQSCDTGTPCCTNSSVYYDNNGLSLYDGYWYGYDDHCWQDGDGDWHGCQIDWWGECFNPSPGSAPAGSECSKTKWGSTWTVDTNKYRKVKIRYRQAQVWSWNGLGGYAGPFNYFYVNIGSWQEVLSGLHATDSSLGMGENVWYLGPVAINPGEMNNSMTTDPVEVILDFSSIANTGNQTLSFSRHIETNQTTLDIVIYEITLMCE